MENQVWLLGREYMVAVNENKEPVSNKKEGSRSHVVRNSHTAANGNKKPSLRANEKEEPNSHTAENDNDEEPCPHDSADENKKPNPQEESIVRDNALV